MFGGKVIKGEGIGKKLGFPTANLEIFKKDLNLQPGVYAVKVIWDHKIFAGALAIQIEPYKVEVYLLDYQGPDFYGVYLEVEPVQKVGEQEKYPNTEELIEKITLDVEKVRAIIK
ncbi:MAG: FMN adenylylate transferase [Candidatus Magasanikbacteria bacterium GW2011_GWC2_37_14]|uniref:riboflavin kinase n=1 Tax=Candidatus Magasanikbacteria bacterium GW2011_GWC2_37_14 TaxID=1619046 RepID=A0A0G0G846_9BACT|nr:MAG: FMN adenylylate transferase [Candidatus Magasanikbacteria bacterium GW2011_GWC2_37_14]